MVCEKILRLRGGHRATENPRAPPVDMGPTAPTATVTTTEAIPDAFQIIYCACSIIVILVISHASTASKPACASVVRVRSLKGTQLQLRALCSPLYLGGVCQGSAPPSTLLFPRPLLLRWFHTRTLRVNAANMVEAAPCRLSTLVSHGESCSIILLAQRLELCDRCLALVSESWAHNDVDA